MKDADSPAAPAGLKEVPFPNPNLLQCRTIRYEEAGPAIRMALLRGVWCVVRLLLLPHSQLILENLALRQ